MRLWSDREYEFITGKIGEADISQEYRRVIRHRIRRKIRMVCSELMKVAEIGIFTYEDIDALLRVVETDLRAKGFTNLANGLRIVRLVIMDYMKVSKKDSDFIEVLDKIAEKYADTVEP